MSGKNWLERDPSQSPGLRRIQEAQQVATVAREEEKRQELERQHAVEVATEENQRKQNRIAEAKLKMATLVPFLEEVKDFANRKGLYPLSHACLTTHDKPDVLIQKARIEIKFDEREEVGYLEVNYAHRGTGFESVNSGDPDHPYSTHVVQFSAACLVGVRLGVNGKTGEVKLFSKHEVMVPAMEEIEPHWEGVGKSSYHSDGVRGHKAYQRMKDYWIPFPNEERQRKQMLADAFHEPMNLGLKRLDEIGNGEIEHNYERTFLDIAESFLGLQ